MDKNEQQNVTFRRMRRSVSFHEMSNTTIFDSTMLSLPDTSINTHKSCCEDLRDKVESLTNNLITANNEIDNLHDEISNLKSELAKCLKVVEVYKRIDCSDSSKTLSNRKKKRLSMHDKNRSTLITSSPTQNVAVSPVTDKCDLVHPVNESPAINISPRTQSNNTTKSNIVPPCISRPERNKLCIISGNKGILATAINTFDNYQICHYLTPNCGIKTLIDKLQYKLSNYTQQDCCIIFIGEEDFRKTSNYCNLVAHIREVLSKINNTKIVLCLPTYKGNDYLTMYNCRIETFNNLLYMDNQSHYYAWVFDSNLNLSYDMFSWYTGRINNEGVLNIFQNLKTLLKDISDEWTDTNVAYSETRPTNMDGTNTMTSSEVLHTNMDGTNLTTSNSDFFRL